VLMTDAAGEARLGGQAAATIILPPIDPVVAPILYTIPVQLLDYYTAVAIIKKAGSLDQDKLIAAASGITVLTPFGMIEYRPIDHQSTMGAYVGKIGVKDGKGYMKDWRFVDGKDVLPSDAEIKEMRPGK